MFSLVSKLRHMFVGRERGIEPHAWQHGYTIYDELGLVHRSNRVCPMRAAEILRAHAEGRMARVDGLTSRPLYVPVDAYRAALSDGIARGELTRVADFGGAVTYRYAGPSR